MAAWWKIGRQGRCEVVDGILVAIPDFPEDNEPEIEPDGDYSHWNEEAEIVRRADEPRNRRQGLSTRSV